MSFFVGLVVGLFLGSVGGFFLAALCHMANDPDDDRPSPPVI
jgi:hypothetical protein